MGAKKLSGALQQRVRSILDEAKSKLLSGDSKGAWNTAIDALNIVPSPNVEYVETSKILSVLGDAKFSESKYAEAIEVFEDAVRCHGGLGDVFIHLRLGQCYFELGDRRRAADELARAYMGGGREAFIGADPKYFGLVEQVLKPPAGMNRLP